SAPEGTTRLGRVLNFADLTALGVGSTLGVGVYVLAGHVARDVAGPSVVISFAIAAIGSFLAGLCYAEFGGREPCAGSAYTYSYICSGELVAFIIGWNLILEYVIGSASVARGVSVYLDSILDGVIGKAFASFAPLSLSFLAGHVDFLAFILAVLFAVALALGVKKSTMVNNLFSLLNLIVVVFVIIAGSIKIDIKNWKIKPETLPAVVQATQNIGSGGFFPFGVMGTIKGAATCFYGYIGFDCISASGEEVQEPRKTIPRAIIATLVIVFISYFGVSAVITLMLPYYDQNRDAPLPYAFAAVGWNFAKWIVAIGGLFGLITSLFGCMFPLPRILYAMASDGLIFRFMGRVSDTYNTPVSGTILAGLLTGLMAALFDLNQLVNMMSIGTLTAYTMVAACVLLLRYEYPVKVYHASDSAAESESEMLLSNHKANKHEEVEDSEVESDEPGKEYDASDSDNYTSTPPQERSALVSKNKIVKHNLRNVLSQVINREGSTTPTSLSQYVFNWLICIYGILCLALGLSLVYGEKALSKLEPWIIVLCTFLSLLLVLNVYAMARQPSSGKPDTFSVPLVPYVPAISIFVNILLILMLDPATWIRFGIWMTIGILLYLLYGLPNTMKEMARDKKITNHNFPYYTKDKK
ncbi:cationic amino acid transporter 2-like, partial [Ctenocephalides felis]|uniref:cationic amino acid transporter 2-like n=1 Tax=Ctenocephalides felis TaxID=7515 RepID=UPI000E6E40CD